jgi:hypothetical protein
VQPARPIGRRVCAWRHSHVSRLFGISEGAILYTLLSFLIVVFSYESRCSSRFPEDAPREFSRPWALSCRCLGPEPLQQRGDLWWGIAVRHGHVRCASPWTGRRNRASRIERNSWKECCLRLDNRTLYERMGGRQPTPSIGRQISRSTPGWIAKTRPGIGRSCTKAKRPPPAVQAPHWAHRVCSPHRRSQRTSGRLSKKAKVHGSSLGSQLQHLGFQAFLRKTSSAAPRFPS